MSSKIPSKLNKQRHYHTFEITHLSLFNTHKMK